eukprot:6358620-Pyramimonas_sp.AAC.1
MDGEVATPCDSATAREVATPCDSARAIEVATLCESATAKAFPVSPTRHNMHGEFDPFDELDAQLDDQALMG